MGRPGLPRTAVLAVSLAVGLSAPACSTSSQATSFVESEPITKVVVNADSGDTTVTASDATTVSVHRTVHQRRGKPKLTRTVSDGVLTLGSRCPSGFLVSCRVDHRIEAPLHTAVVVHTRSGGVRVERMQAAVEVSTGSGSLDLVRPGGTVTARTGSGSIDVDMASDELRLETGSGSVKGQHIVSPKTTVRTGSGSVDLSFVAPPDGLDVTTDSGSVHATVPKGAYQVETSTTSGNVEVTGLQKEKTGRRIKAATSSGSITVEGR